MKLLLCKNIPKLGIVGDVVEVSSGYARNYLLPQRLATEPTDANMRKLAEARRVAEQERLEERRMLEAVAKRLEEVEITVRARANEEGVLYGSVGPREIAASLMEEGHPVHLDQIVLDAPIRHLDNVAVDIKLAPDLRSTIKVWVVREKAEGEPEEEEGEEDATTAGEVGREAATDDNDAAGQ
jgi:large subunit ribosomal protein L9